MLVVAQQRALGIGRQGGLARAGEAEEDGRPARVVDGRRAVHRHDAGLWHHVVEVGEDRLLGLAGVGGAADQHQLLSEVAGDHRLCAHAVALGVGAEGRQVDHREARREGGLLRRRDLAQQVTDEQRVPGVLQKDARVQLVRGACTGAEVLHEQIARGRMRLEVRPQHLEVLRRHGLVVVPPDDRIGGGIANDELVLHGAAGVDTCLDGKRTGRGQATFALRQGQLDQLCVAGVALRLAKKAR